MTPLERMAEAYWDAFRDGYIRVGGNPKEYPKWGSSRDPIKDETLRCLRHAVETLRDVWPDTSPDFHEIFPEPLAKRSIKATVTDVRMAEKVNNA